MYEDSEYSQPLDQVDAWCEAQEAEPYRQFDEDDPFFRGEEDPWLEDKEECPEADQGEEKEEDKLILDPETGEYHPRWVLDLINNRIVW
ncbi:MAG: hypothetical protein KGI54_14695, partial [Pseudomonadota bacterium]|nr:hypothetical protein [Pseudomonadota bacterium]